MKNCLATTNRFNWELEDFFNNFMSFPNFFINSEVSFKPRVNVENTRDNLTLNFELPGMEKGDIKVLVNNNVLTISGERKFEKKSNDNDFIQTEIHSGSFSRSFTLPDTVDAAKVSAEYKNGLLEIVFPKLEEKKPKEISVKVS